MVVQTEMSVEFGFGRCVDPNLNAFGPLCLCGGVGGACVNGAQIVLQFFANINFALSMSPTSPEIRQTDVAR